MHSLLLCYIFIFSLVLAGSNFSFSFKGTWADQPDEPAGCVPSIEGPPNQLAPKESCSVLEDGSIIVTSSVKLPAMPVEFQSKFKAKLQEGMCDYQGAFSRGYAEGFIARATGEPNLSNVEKRQFSSRPDAIRCTSPEEDLGITQGFHEGYPVGQTFYKEALSGKTPPVVILHPN